jgi:transposase
MPGPGEYLPDPTEGITRVEDLPKPKIVRRSRDYKGRPCPSCGHRAYRDRRQLRVLHDIGDLVSGRPRDIRLAVSQHHCTRCAKYFLADSSDLALAGARYTHRVIATAVRLVVEDGLPYRSASWHMWRDHRVFVPFATIQNWVEASGGKSRSRDVA